MNIGDQGSKNTKNSQSIFQQKLNSNFGAGKEVEILVATPKPDNMPDIQDIELSDEPDDIVKVSKRPH